MCHQYIIFNSKDQTETYIFFLQTQTDNLRAWDVERETELENQYKLFLKESKLKELADTARQLAEKEEELFFFDNYDKVFIYN